MLGLSIHTMFLELVESLLSPCDAGEWTRLDRWPCVAPHHVFLHPVSSPAVPSVQNIWFCYLIRLRYRHFRSHWAAATALPARWDLFRDLADRKV